MTVPITISIIVWVAVAPLVLVCQTASAIVLCREAKRLGLQAEYEFGRFGSIRIRIVHNQSDSHLAVAEQHGDGLDSDPLSTN